MIDLHCHILPGIDDGAQTMSDSLEMARAAVSQGITTIVATPHHKNGRYENRKEEILQEVRAFNQRLKEEGIPLDILPGQEPAINGEFIEDLERNELVTLNETQYLFIEFPSSHVPRYSEQMFYDLQIKGIIPVIVHPERNAGVIEHPDVLYKLVKKGALAQVTASSLTGRFGKKIKRFSESLIDANLVHFVASDAHNVSNRGFYLSEAYDLIDKKWGKELLYVFKENAELLTLGQHVMKEPPERIKRKKFLGIF